MNNFKDIKTAVIGVGSMGQHHVRIYNEISNLIGIVEPNKDLGLKIAKKYGVEWLPNCEDLYDRVDAVSIAVPTFLSFLFKEPTFLGFSK